MGRGGEKGELQLEKQETMISPTGLTTKSFHGFLIEGLNGSFQVLKRPPDLQTVYCSLSRCGAVCMCGGQVGGRGRGLWFAVLRRTK